MTLRVLAGGAGTTSTGEVPVVVPILKLGENVLLSSAMSRKLA